MELILPCPVGCQKGFGDDGSANAPTLRGGWSHEAPDEPINVAEELQPLRQAHTEAQKAAHEGPDLEAFLRFVDLPNWVTVRSPPGG